MAAFDTVLCPIDFSDLAGRTAQLAAITARRLGARLVLHHNLEAGPPDFLSVRWMWSEEHEEARRRDAEETPERLTRALEALPEGVECEAKLTRGPLDQAVLEVAERVGAGLIVMGTHGWSDAKHRSLTERMIVAAPCPVLTADESRGLESPLVPRAALPPTDLEFLVPIDFGGDSVAVLRYATRMMEDMPHRLHLLHVVPPSPALDDPAVREATLAERAERLAGLVPEGLRDRTRHEVREGLPADQILAAVGDPTLFVLMPAARPGLLRRVLFGDTTLEVLHGSPVPVWFVPERSLAAASADRRPS